MDAYLVVKQFARTLRNLDAVLDKATKYAEARKFDVSNFCTARIHPDMLPFVFQIRNACDHAKSAAANLSGKTAPKHEDTEKTFPELRERIAKCVAYLDTFTPADFSNVKPDTLIKLPTASRPGRAIPAAEYFYARQIPNVYFHVTTAYAILRHNGVELGKMDFIGSMPVHDG